MGSGEEAEVKKLSEFMKQVLLSLASKTYGDVLNTFYHMEPGYTDREFPRRTWLVGPVSLRNCDADDRLLRGGGNTGDNRYLNWLDTKKPGSVIYLCFGSLGRFNDSQLREIGKGLVSSGHPFLWVVRNAGEESEWMPEGLVEEKGLIIKGWAPQLAILEHPAVGGYVTHCRWNSCLEGATTGKVMVTWPLFAEQFLNERLLVDVLKIGVAVGSKICEVLPEKRTFVGAEEVRKAVEDVMGSGEEAEERRKRSKEIAEKAKNAVAEGGSSYNDVAAMIRHLKDAKANKVAAAEGCNNTSTFS